MIHSLYHYHMGLTSVSTEANFMVCDREKLARLLLQLEGIHILRTSPLAEKLLHC